MKLKSLTIAMLKDQFRDFETVFWTILFPTGMLVLFISIFGQVFGDGGVEARVNYGVHYQEPTYGITDGVVRGIFHEMETTDQGDFSFREVRDLKEGQDLIQEGAIDLVISFPEGFSRLNPVFEGEPPEKTPVTSLRLYHSSRAESLLAKDIFHSVIDETNLQISAQGQEVPMEFQRVAVGAPETGDFSYENFIFPGMILLALMTISFFNLPLGLVDYKEQGVFKKINASPVKGKDYYLGILLSQLVVLILALGALYTAGLFFDISPRVYQPPFIAFLLYASVTVLSFGLLFTAFFKNTATLAPFSNILYFITMFLSGLYFDIQAIPIFLRWYSVINPVTHLVDGLRAIIVENPLPQTSVIIPGVWFLISLGVYTFNQKQVSRNE